MLVALGTCWYNEAVEKVVSFLKETSAVLLETFSCKVLPIVFCANHIHNSLDIDLLYEQTNSIVIKNKHPFYPNKNYGIAAITTIAQMESCEIVSVIDPDWNILDYKNTVRSMFEPVLSNTADIVIPNIGEAAGRSNILIGRTAIKMFYPEYCNKIITPFPGVVIGSVRTIQKIVNCNNYHYDWGGEWDIVAYTINNHFRVACPSIRLLSTKHRSNVSKFEDAYQIWKAIFTHLDNNPAKWHFNLSKSDLDMFQELCIRYSNNELSDTYKLLFIMVYFPIKSLFSKQISNHIIYEYENSPYNENELPIVEQLAPLFAKIALNDSCSQSHDDIKSASQMMSPHEWNDSRQKEAMASILHTYSRGK